MRIVFVVLAFGLVQCDCGGSAESTDGGRGRDAANMDAARDSARPSLDASLRCGDLTAVLRDFRADHPDFEGAIASERGLVEDTLGDDGLPVYAGGGGTTTTNGRESFDQWYRDVPDVNMRFEIPFPLTEESPGTFVFDNGEFFPLDGLGWPGEETMGHNFHFTTEIRGTFTYEGGEVFTFRGDDDVFVFVNRQLALDLGGVHPVETATIDFDAQADALGIAVGGTYALDVFHAERHTTQSNFRIETSIECLGGLI